MEEQVRRIRDFISSRRRQYRLLRNRALWLQLCSSLDVIEDTQLAVDSYRAGEIGGSLGARYLAVYGLLQALAVQQDAVVNLCESLGVPQKLDDHPRLRDIRQIRIESVGHPTKKGLKKGQPTSHHFIGQITLTDAGFTLISEYSDGRFESKDVSTSDLVAEQEECVRDILITVIDRLEHEDAVHKEQFRMEKLAELFPPTLGYYFEKISTAAAGDDSPAMGAAGLQGVRAALQAFQEALLRRGLALDTYDCIKYTYEELEYPLAQLDAFFETLQFGLQPNMDERAAYIFAWFLRSKIGELQGMAREIDADYSS